jgi:hypothetical protein
MQLIAQAKRFYKALLAAGSSFTVRDYEAFSILAWRDKLSQPAMSVLDKQLDLITWINRQSKEKLVLFHPDSEEKWNACPGLLFPLRRTKTVARISIRIAGSKGPALNSDIVLFDGRLHSIEFDRVPRTIFSQSMVFRVAGLKQVTLAALKNVEVRNVKILEDPMQAGRVPASGPIARRTWTGVMKEWAGRWELGGIREPLPESDRQKIISEIDAALPPDYLKVVEQTERLEIGPWTIFGLSEIRKVVRPDGNFYIVAQLDESSDLAVAQGSKDNALYLIPYEGDLAERMAGGFRTVIEQKLQNVT